MIGYVRRHDRLRNVIRNVAVALTIMLSLVRPPSVEAASPSSITLVTSANPSTFGQSVTLTGTVTPNTATGKVTFYDGTTVLATVTLSGAGIANLPTTLLPAGTRSLKAYYAGDASFDPSSSAVLLQTVAPNGQYGFGTTIRHVGSPTLEPTCPSAIGGNPPNPANTACLGVVSDIVVSDFNGDGKADIAVYGTANHNPGLAYGIHLLLGNADGTFQPWVYTSTGTGQGVNGISVGDLDQDGQADDLIVPFNGAGFKVLLGNGNGTFTPGPSSPNPGGIYGGAAVNVTLLGDFNGDGIADVVAATTTGIAVYLGGGSGVFAFPPVSDGDIFANSSFRRIASGDFNGDGNVDLVTTNPAAANIEVRIGNGNGTFQAPLITSSGFPGNLTGRVAVADFNGDGKADIALKHSTGVPGSTGVSIRLGNGDGTFATAVFYPDGPGSELFVSDFNSDGTLDIVTGDAGDTVLARVFVYYGNGDGTLQVPPVGYSSGLGAPGGNFGAPTPGSAVTAMAVGEFNGDGLVDLVTGGFNTFNNNGAVNYLTTVLGTQGTPTTLTSSPNPSVVGQPVTLTATVTPSTAAGTVTFKDGPTALGTAPLVLGSAQLITPALAAGPHMLYALYSGDGSNVPGTGHTTHQVNLFVTPPTITSITPSKGTLYPADRRMAAIGLTVAATDPLGGAVSCVILSVTFNTPLRGAGPDFVLTGPLALNLRAERPTSIASRKYTITVQCTNTAGGIATATVDISVGLPPGRDFSAVGGPDVLLVPACETCAWTASSRVNWITITSGASGVGEGRVSYTVAQNTSAAARTGALVIGAQTITITQAGVGALPIGLPAGAPFGSVDSPASGATGVTGSLAITGWALDDTEVARVRIYRAPVTGEPAGSPIYLGDAVLVPGARPDIEKAYATAPFASRAGWGYLLLTNMLPNQGNGTYTLSAYADDREGQATLLGTRTITGANRSATRPFGAIDTPAQGETIAGKAYVNFGWALTPLPKAIGTDGSTIQVYIDGALVGPVSYNHHRSDIAALFPGLANTGGASAHRVIDTTKYANGLHTISWAVMDSAGISEGIGSRYFTIQNATQPLVGAGRQTGPSAEVRLRPDATTEVRLRRGYDTTRAVESLPRGDDGAFLVRSDALERLEIDLGAGATMASVLPIGSALDVNTGSFTWLPGPGFVGGHELIFVRGSHRIVVRVTIEP